MFYYSPAFYVHGHDSVMSAFAVLFQTMQNLIPKPCQFSNAHHGENKRRQTEKISNLQLEIKLTKASSEFLVQGLIGRRGQRK